LKNHHNTQKAPLPAENAPSFVLQSSQLADSQDDSDELNGYDGDGGYAPEDGDAPLIIAEATVAVKTMAVSMAVMQLDLSEAPVLLFRNAAHGGLSVVYRRADG